MVGASSEQASVMEFGFTSTVFIRLSRVDTSTWQRSFTSFVSAEWKTFTQQNCVTTVCR